MKKQRLRKLQLLSFRRAICSPSAAAEEPFSQASSGTWPGATGRGLQEPHATHVPGIARELLGITRELLGNYKEPAALPAPASPGPGGRVVSLTHHRGRQGRRVLTLLGITRTLPGNYYGITRNYWKHRNTCESHVALQKSRTLQRVGPKRHHQKVRTRSHPKVEHALKPQRSRWAPSFIARATPASRLLTPASSRSLFLWPKNVKNNIAVEILADANIHGENAVDATTDRIPV